MVAEKKIIKYVSKINHLSRHLNLFIFSLISIFLFSCKTTQNLLIKTEIICKDKSINIDDLESCIKQKPNRKTFGVRLHLGIYQLVDLEKERIREEQRAIKLQKINEKRRIKFSEQIKKYDTKQKYYQKLADSFAVSEPKQSAKYLKKAKEYENHTKERFVEKEKIFSFSQWFLEIGEPPAIYDKNQTYKSKSLIKQYLENKGYYNAKIKDSLVYTKTNKIIKTVRNGYTNVDTVKKITVYYIITPNKIFTIDSIGYKIDDDWIKKYIMDDNNNSLLKKGNAFDRELLQAERERITNYLKQLGYYKFLKEYIFFIVDTISGKNKAKIFISIKKPVDETGAEIGKYHKKYRINQVYIYPEYDPKTALEKQLIYNSDFDTTKYVYNDEFTFKFVTKYQPFVKKRSLTRQIYIYPDSLYNIVNYNDTYKHLSSMRIFKLINIELIEKDSVPVSFVDKIFKEIRTQVNNIRRIYSDSIKYGYLDCNIKLTPTTLQSTTIEMEGTNTSGNIGAASIFQYQHKNIFNGAEIFDIKLRTAFENQINSVTDNNRGLFNTYEIGVDFQIEYPKLLFLPKYRYETFQKRNNPKTNLNFAFNYQERPDYTRRIINLALGYSWKTSDFITHYFSPITFNSIDLVKSSNEFYSYLLRYGLWASYSDYVIASINYSLIYSDQTVMNRRNFFYIRINAESAGNITNLAMKTLKQPKDENGSYLFPYFNIPFAQYLRADIDFRYYQNITSRNSTVFRFFAGAGYPYGNTKSLPFIKQYFAGGANSVRAWQVRSLGPGTYRINSPDSLIITKVPSQTSDIKIEANLEFRQKMFWIIEGALFVDVGNIWSISSTDSRPGAVFKFNSFIKEFAIGTGFGIRLDFSFFLFRIDFGKKVYDPQIEEGSRWVLNQNFFDPAVWTFNVGIGYPF